MNWYKTANESELNNEGFNDAILFEFNKEKARSKSTVYRSGWNRAIYSQIEIDRNEYRLGNITKEDFERFEKHYNECRI